MKAERIKTERIKLSDNRFLDIAIWRLPAPLTGSAHPFKYRLAFVDNGRCVLRYDNEAGKGDHKHIGAREVPYTFISLDQLIDDFWADIQQE
ncbi:toxin-antitoxin system TumE family protein [Imhoffiella purpurea]|uniref:Uncharacterized protein n=1 Tax=Imhoffiella purpurea TaxID=1249627 RepID=W9V1M9_9GAMM|nr:DUF6516 family protein [Imhoffiella purpurea]EXJ13363.1 hypothetical protein D779_3835 [Imhoffiella purpurea]